MMKFVSYSGGCFLLGTPEDDVLANLRAKNLFRLARPFETTETTKQNIKPTEHQSIAITVPCHHC